jgi:hypothetical protein
MEVRVSWSAGVSPVERPVLSFHYLFEGEPIAKHGIDTYRNNSKSADFEALLSKVRTLSHPE